MSTLPTFEPETTSTTPEPVAPGQQTAIPIPPAPAAAQPPKNKGGRPKGSKNKGKAPQQPPTPPTPATTPADEELKKLAAEYKPDPAAQPPQPGQAAPATPPPGQAFVITGHLALIVVDTFIPSGMAWVLNRYGWKVTPDQLKLTEKERQDIEPIMDAVVKQLTADPRVILLLALVGAYAGKIPPKPAKKPQQATT